MAVARSSSGVVIRYVLPVLWMTPCFYTTGLMGRNQAGRYVKKEFARSKVIWEQLCRHRSRQGCPIFTSKTAPSLRLSPPHLIHPSVNRNHSPLQTASRSNQPFFHNSPTGQTDRQMGWRQACTDSCLRSINCIATRTKKLQRLYIHRLRCCLLLMPFIARRDKQTHVSRKNAF